MTYLAFVKQERRLLSFAVSFTFVSSFGQTFLFSLFVPYFLTAFDLSNASFGTLYSSATLTGAFLLPWLGQWIDRIPLRQYSMYVAGGLTIASLLMAISWHISILFVSILMLRLSGQGLSGHTAQTTMARYYDHERGKALSISSLGYPIGEGLLPSVIAAMLVLFHWRTTWGIISAIIALVFIPLLWGLIRKERETFDHGDSPDEIPTASESYKNILSDKRVPFIVPALLIPPFWITGLFLYQVSLGEELGWSAALIASSFIAFALLRVAGGLFSGPLIDRFSARKLFPFLLIPMAFGLLAGAFIPGNFSVYIYMGLMGATMGMAGTVKPALYAELFGKKVVGTVQSFFASIMVFSTAASPLLVGWMIDAGITITTIFHIAILTSVISGLLSIGILLIKSDD